MTLLLALMCGSAFAVPPTSPSAPATTLPGPPPTTPGFHHLYYSGQIDGQPRTFAYSVYLPKNYDPARPCPMIVYLVGLGDRGEDHQGLFNNGPPVYLSSNPELADWAPFIILAPQCPRDLRWETPGVAGVVHNLIDYAAQTWAVDRDRLYLTGLSNGGAGCWNLALEAPNKFAAIAVFSSMDADLQHMPAALAGTTVWIICGSADGRFAAASHKMYEALHAAKLDVLLVEIPEGRHGIWYPFFSDRGFYEFLLGCRRNAPSAANRPTVEDFLAISKKPPNTADDELEKPLHNFLPWWFVNNCSRDALAFKGKRGILPGLLGRRSVFVTAPLSKEVPCRLMYTADIPAGQHTALDLTVAAPPQAQWELVVRANGDTLAKRLIGEGTPPVAPAASPSSDPWVNVHVDLTPLAGKQVYLELLNAAAGADHSEACWGSVQLTSQ